ncbi:MAG TPA: hypothetical protein VFV99_14240 [Kofleriaceae bacterium]|nr:hypothetical protein [Kofleriaceae bacterium]
MVAVWPRANYVVGGGPGEIALIALSTQKMPDPLPVSRKQHGMPDEGSGANSVALVARDRAEDPAWFTESVIAPFADLIAADLGPQHAAAALAAEHAYVIEAQHDDPDDLGHLQAAWALAKCLCEEGATVVIDVYAARAHLGSEVAALSPERSFDIMHEVTLFFDESDDGSIAAWSLGLRKFGRPDIVLLGLTPESATEAALLLRDIAATLASGERIEPGDTVEGPDREFKAERFDPESAPVVAVEGDAILLR